MAELAETAFKRMIATFVRQTRPQSFRNGKPSRYPQRSLATAVVAQPVKDDEQVTPTWEAHTLVQSDSNKSPSKPRLDKLRSDLETRPFSSFLTDNYAREHNYLRISITERCNLRCLYCMPEEGIPLSPPAHSLTTPEIVYLSSLFVSQGVNKIRLTGGEPTVRKDIVDLMRQIGELRKDGLKELCLTTNGISLHRKLDAMVESGLTGVNLSLDTLDPFQFTIMTRRNGHDAVMKSINRILEMNKVGAGIKLKINCVVMRGMNERELVPFVEMGKEKDLEVRFIEYMPFDGNKWSQKKMLSYQEMLALIREKYPGVQPVRGHTNDTSKTYKIPGFEGRIGFITSMTHNFCGTCNRLRITSDGNLKVCLFGNSEVSLRDILRESNEGKPIDAEAMEAIKQLEMDRRQALPGSIGAFGLSPKESQLLDVIGVAVKRKKEKHAGMGELENMKNRPMILIDASLLAPTSSLSNHNQLLVQKSLCPPAVPTKPTFNTNVPLHLLSSHNTLLTPQRRYLMTRTLSRTYLTGRFRHVYSHNLHRRVPTGPPIKFDEDNLEEIRVEPDTSTVEVKNNGIANPKTEPVTRGTAPEFSQVGLPEISTKYEPTDNELHHDDLLEYESGLQSTDSNISALLPTSINIKDNPEAKQKKPKISKDGKLSIKQLTHLTSSGEAHMVDIRDKRATVRSAKARAFVYFGNEDTFPALVSGNSKKGDALAVARIAGIQAAKKAADLIPLAHPGLGLTGVQVEITPFRANPNKESRHAGVLGLPQFGGVRVSATVDCYGKTGVEMEALTSVTVAALTVYDMLKGVDKEMLITSARVLAKSGGKSGDWEWDAPTRRIKYLTHPIKKSDSELSRENIDIQMQMIQIGKAKLKHEAEKIQLQREMLQLEHEKSKWREDRLRHEKEKLQNLAEEMKMERKKIALSAINIQEEIERGQQEILSSTGGGGGGGEELKPNRHLRDLCSGDATQRLNASDFEQMRINRYAAWSKEH